jgi:predicted lipase
MKKSPIEIIKCWKIILKDYSVIFHGHSLGGAVSSLAAVRAVDTLLLSSEKVRHYTQGEPRIGNYTFAKHFDSHVPHR